MKTKRFRYSIGLLNNMRTHTNSVLSQKLHIFIINKFQISKLHTVSKHVTYPPYIRIYHWTLYMEDSNPWSLIIKMFANSKTLAILVNSYRKKAFCSNGSSYPEALESYLKHWKLIFSIRIYNLMVLFLNRHLYGWRYITLHCRYILIMVWILLCDEINKDGLQFGKSVVI